MENRRNFLKKSALGTLGVSTVMSCNNPNKTSSKPVFPRIISTWNHGLDANKKAWEVLKNGQGGLSAVEEGVKVTEADPNVRSVGLGGYPDRDGIVTLDACIMDKDSNCGSVSYLQNIKHPISVARHVMEDTPHVMLSGSGALDFAISKGFKQKIYSQKHPKMTG
jgi:N4-(beta-N-acetylglucosaminyl)-L-asparaginase